MDGEKKSKLIMLVGGLDVSFIINELDFVEKYFGEVVIFTAPLKKNVKNDIISKFNVKIIEIKVNFLMPFLNFKIYKWLLNKEVKEELKKIIKNNGKNKLKKCSYLLFYGLFYLSYSKKVQSEVVDKDIDIFLYSFWLGRTAYLASKINEDFKKKILKSFSRAHGYDLYEYRNKFSFLPFRNYINNHLDEIFFVSQDGLNYHLQQYGEISAKRTLSLIGVANPDNLKKEIKEKKYICIASCSRIIQVKRLDLIIDTLTKIDLPIKWIHIGVGELEKKVKREASKKLSKTYYQFIGEVKNSDILQIYMDNDVDFFINLSDSEGIPVSIMEAMSLGIPTIARNVGGNNEIISSHNGLLISASEESTNFYQEIECFLKQRLNNVDNYTKIVEQTLLVWTKNYESNKNYNEFINKIINKAIR